INRANPSEVEQHDLVGQPERSRLADSYKLTCSRVGESPFQSNNDDGRLGFNGDQEHSGPPQPWRSTGGKTRSVDRGRSAAPLSRVNSNHSETPGSYPDGQSGFSTLSAGAHSAHTARR